MSINRNIYFSGFVDKTVCEADLVVNDDSSLRSLQAQSVPELCCVEFMLDELVLPTINYIYFTKNHSLLQYELNSRNTSVITNEQGVHYNALEWFRDHLFIICDFYGKQVIKLYSEFDGTCVTIDACVGVSMLSIGKSIGLLLSHEKKVYMCKNLDCEVRYVGLNHFFF